MNAPKYTVRAAAAILLPVVLAAGAAAHDFWIECSPWRAPAGSAVALDLRVGDGFPGEAVARNGARIARFVCVGPGGQEHPAAGTDGQTPAGAVRSHEAGVHVTGFLSNHAYIEIEGAHFTEHLKEKGLDKVIKARADAGKSEEMGKERYARCAKAIHSVGDAGDGAGFDRELGFALELIPETNPLGVKPGEELVVRLEFHGAPCADALLISRSRENPSAVQSARTDKEGRARVRIDAPGAWVLAAVEMTPAKPLPEGAVGAHADWESWWASLSFEVGAAADR